MPPPALDAKSDAPNPHLVSASIGFVFPGTVHVTQRCTELTSRNRSLSPYHDSGSIYRKIIRQEASAALGAFAVALPCGRGSVFFVRSYQRSKFISGENKARKAAKVKGTSVSRWIAQRVVETLEDAWPKGVLDAAGAIPAFPGVEEIRAGYGKDATRERIR